MYKVMSIGAKWASSLPGGVGAQPHLARACRAIVVCTSTAVTARRHGQMNSKGMRASQAYFDGRIRLMYKASRSTRSLVMVALPSRAKRPHRLSSPVYSRVVTEEPRLVKRKRILEYAREVGPSNPSSA